MSQTYTFHRGTYVIGNKVFDTKPHTSTDWGSSVMSEMKEPTMSCQRFYPESNSKYYGYDLNNFARVALRDKPNAKPVIWEGEIIEEAFNQIKDHLYVILRRDTYDILEDTSMISSNAQIVCADRFSFEEFLNYSGELLIGTELLKDPEVFGKLVKLKVYPAEELGYDSFLRKYYDGKISPIYRYNDISESDEQKCETR